MAAKEKKDARKAEAAEIASTANELTLTDGAGEIALPMGSISVRGSWGDASVSCSPHLAPPPPLRPAAPPRAVCRLASCPLASPL